MSILGSYIKFLAIQIEEGIEDNVGELLPKGSNIVFLDCGCDDGLKTIKRANKIGTDKILGLENISERAAIARKNNVEVHVANLDQKWPFGDSSIDCITATEVVEHLVNLDNFFSEAFRVLKKGGYIIISTENLAAYHNILALILGNQPYTGPYLSRIYPIGHRPSGKFYEKSLPMDPHLNVMTYKSLLQLLKAYKFKIVKSKGVGFYPIPAPLSKIFSSIDNLHSSYVVVSAQK